MDAGHRFVMAGPAVLEAYSVLTRLPPPFRLSPLAATRVLYATWGRNETVSLTGAEYWKLVLSESARGTAGGRVYDAVIARCTRKAQASDLVTWNTGHFAAFAEPGLRIRRPGENG